MEKSDELKYYAEKQGKGIGEPGEVYIAGRRFGPDGPGSRLRPRPRPRPRSRSRPEALPPFFSRSSSQRPLRKAQPLILLNLIPNDMLHLTR